MHRCRHANGDVSRQRAQPFRQLFANEFGLIEKRACARQQEFADLRELNAARIANQKFAFQGVLKPLDLPGECRLRNSEFGSRFR